MRYIIMILLIMMVLTGCAQIDRFVCPPDQDRYECESNILSGIAILSR